MTITSATTAVLANATNTLMTTNTTVRAAFLLRLPDLYMAPSHHAVHLRSRNNPLCNTASIHFCQADHAPDMAAMIVSVACKSDVSRTYRL
jgi:hypothetical protein